MLLQLLLPLYATNFTQTRIELLTKDFVFFLTKIKNENHYENLVLYTLDEGYQRRSLTHESLSQLTIPKLLLDTRSQCDLDAIKHKQALLIWCNIDRKAGKIDFENLDKFVKCLGHFRHKPIVFYFNWNEHSLNKEKELYELFEYCQQNFMLNVVAIFFDFRVAQRFYTYTKFPTFHIQMKHLSVTCFPDRLLNLYGTPIRTLPDQNEPRSIVYRDRHSGELKIVGYVAKIIQTFAQKYNATLVYPLNAEKLYFYTEIQSMMLNNELDLPMSMKSPISAKAMHIYSAVVEQATWFPMIPLAQPISTANIFLLIIGSRLSVILLVLWLSFTALLSCKGKANINGFHILKQFYCFVHNVPDTLRGILGQSIYFSFTPRFPLNFIYTLLFVVGIIFSTTYAAYFNTFLTSAPRPRQIMTFADLLQAQIRVRIHAMEYKSMPNYAGAEFWQHYGAIFLVTKDSDEYYAQRKSFDTNYAYLVTSSYWFLIQQQQARMLHSLFHHSEQMYFFKGLCLSVSLHEHCIYREPLNTLILQLQESGLLSYWQSLAYMELFIAGKLNSSATANVPLVIERSLSVLDFYWIWALHVLGVAIAMVAFIFEIVFYYKICHPLRKTTIR